MRLFPREAVKATKDLLRLFPVVAVIGARQAGKTTLCSVVGDKWKQYDLERESDYRLMQEDPLFFLQQHPERVIIDEAQELPSLFPALRVAVDAHRGKRGRYLITGSSSPDLLSSIAETLAGRIGVLELPTLKATEAWRKKKSSLYRVLSGKIDRTALESLRPVCSRKELFESWLYGGYPEPFQVRGKKDYYLWMDNYRSTYLQRDIRRLFPRLDHSAFRTFLGMLARMSGTIINYAEVARALSVSQPTVREYIDIAHGTFLWRKLEPFSRDAFQRITKMPKGHFRDSGLLHFLLNIDSPDELAQDPIVGRSWEGFIAEELLKGFTLQLIPHQPYYYRTSHGGEIDLILESRFGLLPIEIKYGTVVGPQTLRTIKEFISHHRHQLGLVINNASRVEWLADKILQVPATFI